LNVEIGTGAAVAFVSLATRPWTTVAKLQTPMLPSPASAASGGGASLGGGDVSVGGDVSAVASMPLSGGGIIVESMPIPLSVLESG